MSVSTAFFILKEGSMNMNKQCNVAYLGPEGTFSYFTCQEYLHAHALGLPCDLIACHDLPAVFEAIVSGACDMGIVPLENSLRGTVGQSFDLFLQHNVQICGEVFSPVSHNLMSNERDLDSIRIVYSHAQPLAQCGMWLRSHLQNASLVAMQSTAMAAARVAEEPGSAVLGHALLAEMYELQTLAEHVEDACDNWTRFVLIGLPEVLQITPCFLDGKVLSKAYRSSLLFTLPDRTGALAMVLNVLAEYSINMCKLESRPLSGERWKYAFFLDVECDLARTEYAPVREALAACTLSCRLLGTYAVGLQCTGISLMQGE